MQASMDSEMVRENLDELGEELQTVASLVQLSIKNQQHEGIDESSGAFDCSGDAERKFENLKGEVQTLARVLDGNGTSLASLTAGSLADVNRLADQAARCKSAINALDGLCQAEEQLTSSHHLLAQNEYVQAADAVASADALLADLQRAEAESPRGGDRTVGGGGGRSGVNKENTRNSARIGETGGGNGVLRALKRLLLKRRAGLESHLRDLANASVELGEDGTTIRCRKVFSGYQCEIYFRSPVPLGAVFDGLARLGQLDILFSELSKRLREEVIGPLLSARYVPPPKRVTSDEMASLTYAPAERHAGPAGPTKSNSMAKQGGLSSKRRDGGGSSGGGGGGADGSGGRAFDDISAVEASGLVTELLARVSVVLDFMHEEVLGGQRHLTAVLGDRLLPEAGGLSKALLGKLDDHVPHSAQHLADFERGTRDACREFETRLDSMGYFGDEGEDGTEAAGSKASAVRGNLSRFVDTLDGRFAAKRRRTLLGQARDMALGDYHNTVQVSDALEGSAETSVAEVLPTQVSAAGHAVKGGKQDSSAVKTFRLEACQVSTVAKAFVSLVRATLTEATSDEVPPHCAKELFRTARDMLDIFRAVIPVQHANALDGVPRIAAVFQNDCLYLAHHMVTLGHEFRGGLPPPANQTATMVDTVPLFRELAAQSLSEQQRRQQQQLQEFFAEVDVLASTETSAPVLEAADSAFEGIFPGDDAKTIPAGRGGLDRGWMTAGKRGGGEVEASAYEGGAGEEGRAAAAVRKSVYHLRQLRQAWWKVLPDRAYTRVMGALMSLVAGKVCTPVLGAKDLGEEQTYALYRIFKTLEEAADDIFDSPGEAAQHTPGWTKAVVVGQIMELGLEAIGERLQGDAFRPLSADELSGLVRAIFQETPARAAVLTAIGQD